MPVVTERQLRRHEELYGSEGIEELVPYLELAKASPVENGFSTRGTMRPVRSSSSTPVPDVVYPWNSTKTRNLGERIVWLRKRGRSVMTIADTVDKTEKVVRRYLREAEQAGLLRTRFIMSPVSGLY